MPTDEKDLTKLLQELPKHGDPITTPPPLEIELQEHNAMERFIVLSRKNRSGVGSTAVAIMPGELTEVIAHLAKITIMIHRNSDRLDGLGDMLTFLGSMIKNQGSKKGLVDPSGLDVRMGPPGSIPPTEKN